MRMTLDVGRRLSPAGGVEITGIDLAQPLAPKPKARIRAAFLDHHIVVFPGQSLTREQQYEFAANFGEVEPHGDKRRTVAHVISNLGQDGNPVDRSSSPVSNYRWHTDKSWRAVPPLSTMLYAVEMPPQGGDTEFANTRMAYAWSSAGGRAAADRSWQCARTRRWIIRSCAPIRRPGNRRSTSATTPHTY